MDHHLSLAGKWRFALDPDRVGLGENWPLQTLPGSISLPGTLGGQGIGTAPTAETPWIGQIIDRSWFTEDACAPYRESGSVKVPFWLQPEAFYRGAAWHQTEAVVPDEWKGLWIRLFLERTHWLSQAWLDGKPVGGSDSLSVPHELDLGFLEPGAHVLTILVDNDLIIDIGVDSHCISDHTQGNWNGLVGRMELRAMPATWVEDVQVFPRVEDRSILARGSIACRSGLAGAGEVFLSAGAAKAAIPVAWNPDGGSFEARLELGPEAGLWDEFSPVCHRLTARLGDGPSFEAQFGLREIAAQGTRFMLNGRPIFLRGTLESCIFPLTGHPPMTAEEWLRIFGTAKAHGLNHIRFHSYCPPEAAFLAADALGLYLQVETCWANASTTVGDGRPVDAWIHRETERILKAYGSHPSFLFMPYGNEPGGARQEEFLTEYVSRFKALDPRRLWTSGAGWPEIDANQFHITPSPRIQQWGEGLESRINSLPPATMADYREFISARSVPVVSHEIGQWCAYPNLEETSKYTGCLKARSFEIFRDFLASAGMEDQAHDFLMASGRLQSLCYKEEIESALRTPGMGGFQLLGLHDFPGQGTAPVGVLDAFWESKGYITAEQHSRFCGPTVPLVRLPKRVFTASEALQAEVAAAHYGPEPLRDARVSWRLSDKRGAVLAEGGWTVPLIPLGSGLELGKIEASLDQVQAPCQARLAVDIEGRENDWDLWIYPEMKPSLPLGVHVAAAWDEEAAEALASGGRVLYMPPRGSFANDPQKPVKLGFSSIFWNTAWTSRQAPTTLGILCNPSHPALERFPTEFHSNWQWWSLIRRAGPILMDRLPKGLRPVVQVIDDWSSCHRLGLLFEARVGAGSLAVCSIDLWEADDPASRQFAESLYRWLEGSEFCPEQLLEPDDVRRLTASD